MGRGGLPGADTRGGSGGGCVDGWEEHSQRGWIWGSERSICRSRKCSDGLCEESWNGSRERFIGLFRKGSTGTSVVGQWLTHWVPTAGDVGSIPGQGSYALCGQMFKKLKTKTTEKTPWRTIYIYIYIYINLFIYGCAGSYYCVGFL